MAKKKSTAPTPDSPETPGEDAPKDAPATEAAGGAAPEAAGGTPPEGASEGAAEAGAESEAGAEGEARVGPKRNRKKRLRRAGHQHDGKLIRAAREKIDKRQIYPLDEALALLDQAAPKRKFDESVELVLKLGIDPKKQDQAVRGSVGLPRGIGREVRVIAFCDGDDAVAASEAGALEVGGEELVKKIKDGWLEFDKAIAAPSMMRLVGQLGRILGPQGKMPTPKDGTVTPKVAEAVKGFRLGRISYRSDDHGNVHAVVGKRSFERDALIENINAFIEHLVASRPSGVKGTFVERIAISTTMGPAVRVSLASSR